MKKYSFSVWLLVRRLLPPFLRGAKMQVWLDVLLQPVTLLLDDLNTFAAQKTIEARYTSQTLSLQDWLNRRFDADQRRILVLHATEQSDYDYFHSEGQPSDYDYLPEENHTFGYLYFSGENTEGFAEDFRVQIPLSLNEKADEIRAQVLRYKFAGYTYAIIN